jgi:putative dehydrogenase
MRVAVIGLGAMGAAVAANLVRRGFEVAGFDPRTAARDALAAAGGAPAATAQAAAAGARVVVTFVVNAAQVRDAVLGEGGAAHGMADDSVLVQCATVPAAFITDLAAQMAARGLPVLDAPVSGGVLRAADGTLTVMMSGDPQAKARARPVVEAIGQSVHDFGDTAGAGSTVKTINQLLCGVHLAVLGEALALGRRAGLDPARLLEVYGGSAAASWMLNDRGPRALQDTPPTRSAVDIFVKDLGLVLDTGRALTFPLPMSAAAHQLFLAMSAQGLGNLDDSQLWRAYPPPPKTPTA